MEKMTHKDLLSMREPMDVRPPTGEITAEQFKAKLPEFRRKPIVGYQGKQHNFETGHKQVLDLVLGLVKNRQNRRGKMQGKPQVWKQIVKMTSTKRGFKNEGTDMRKFQKQFKNEEEENPGVIDLEKDLWARNHPDLVLKQKKYKEMSDNIRTIGYKNARSIIDFNDFKDKTKELYSSNDPVQSDSSDEQFFNIAVESKFQQTSRLTMHCKRNRKVSMDFDDQFFRKRNQSQYQSSLSRTIQNTTDLDFYKQISLNNKRKNSLGNDDYKDKKPLPKITRKRPKNIKNKSYVRHQCVHNDNMDLLGITQNINSKRRVSMGTMQTFGHRTNSIGPETQSQIEQRISQTQHQVNQLRDMQSDLSNYKIKKDSEHQQILRALNIKGRYIKDKQKTNKSQTRNVCKSLQISPRQYQNNQLMIGGQNFLQITETAKTSPRRNDYLSSTLNKPNSFDIIGGVSKSFDFRSQSIQSTSINNSSNRFEPKNEEYEINNLSIDLKNIKTDVRNFPQHLTTLTTNRSSINSKTVLLAKLRMNNENVQRILQNGQ